MEHSGEQSRRKRHADDPEVPDHTFEGSPETNLEHKSKRVRDREEADLNLLYRDDSEYLYWADACGTCSLFPLSDDYQKSSLCTADRKDEIALGDGFVADEIWMSPVSIDYGANDGFLENASVLSNDSEVCTSSMEKGTEEAFNEVREWLLSEESSPSYTANSSSCSTEAEACCMAQALKGVARS